MRSRNWRWKRGETSVPSTEEKSHPVKLKITVVRVVDERSFYGTVEFDKEDA